MVWKELDLEASQRLEDARLQMHWAAQIPAAIGDQMIAKRDDWSHSAFTWDPTRRAVVTDVAHDRLRAALTLDDLVVRLLDAEGREQDAFPLVGTTLAAGFQWLGGRVGQTLTYSELSIPPHAVREDGATLTPETKHLSVLADWFENAHAICAAIRKNNAGASPVRIWPHHFDIATLMTLDADKSSEEARSVGVGMSPGDGSFAEPYFYITPWPYPDKGALPRIEGPGHWHTEGFVAGVLTARELQGASQASAVQQFVDGYAAASRSALFEQ